MKYPGKNLLKIAVKINAKDAKIASKLKQGFECTSLGVRNFKKINDTSKQTTKSTPAETVLLRIE